jgi:hypothetical protein
MHDLFKGAVFGEIVNIEASVVQSHSYSYCRDGAVSSGDAIESLVGFGDGLV